MSLSLPDVVPDPADPFDEHEYLAANPDVAAAVEAGALKTGWDHYKAWGKTEGRVLKFAESRIGRLLVGLDVASTVGIEIGALDKPVVKKSDGNIFYVDYADTQYLRNRYKDDPAVNTENIVQVDGIWGQKTLAEVLGPGRRVDYVLASHVVEHVPDLISWLREIRAVLIDGGILRLVVPDRRYTFDYTRRESALADVLDAHIRKARAPSPRQILDHCLNVRKVDVLAAWEGPLEVPSLKRHFSDQDAFALAIDAFKNHTYQDVHCWVFTPRSFIELMQEIADLGLIDLRCETITETRRGQLEFIVGMRADTDRQAVIDSWKLRELQ